VREVLKETSGRGDWDREGSKGLRCPSSVLPISSRPQRGDSVSSEASASSRTR
jgi:hypothetical protein